MKNNLILKVGTIVVLLVAVIGVWFVLNPSTNTAEIVTPTSKPAVKTQQETEMLDLGNYVEFYDGVLQETSDKQRVLYFYANWCPTCQPVDRELREAAENGELPKNLVVIRVNYNDSDTDSAEKQLAIDYGVTYQHSFVIVNTGGNEVDKWNGGGLSDILERI